jgi:hypothetical protein
MNMVISCHSLSPDPISAKAGTRTFPGALAIPSSSTVSFEGAILVLFPTHLSPVNEDTSVWLLDNDNDNTLADKA